MITKPPWKVKVSDETKQAKVYPEIFSGSRVVARAYAWGDKEAPRMWDQKWVEMLDNAKLIEAAPALAAGLRDALAIYEGTEDARYCYSTGPIEKLDKLNKLLASLPKGWEDL